ncbi:MAG: hypothetical protein K2G93_06690, partial [Rikenella sp.]|nr:hypothetical protein [Rikenella sp.]
GDGTVFDCAPARGRVPAVGLQCFALLGPSGSKKPTKQAALRYNGYRKPAKAPTKNAAGNGRPVSRAL